VHTRKKADWPCAPSLAAFQGVHQQVFPWMNAGWHINRCQNSITGVGVKKLVLISDVKTQGKELKKMRTGGIGG
jgi:hypothetical protein